MRKYPFGSVIVTSIGGLGIDSSFVPIPPMTNVPCLVCVGTVQDKPVVINKAIEIRPIANIVLTTDHRYFDGARVNHIFKKVNLFHS
jgi:pyruvate/2-oxoglutarate dehydrogenase complex dihydrolipoamide acyltransferase (E2) component